MSEGDSVDSDFDAPEDDADDAAAKEDDIVEPQKKKRKWIKPFIVKGRWSMDIPLTTGDYHPPSLLSLPQTQDSSVAVSNLLRRGGWRQPGGNQQ